MAKRSQKHKNLDYSFQTRPKLLVKCCCYFNSENRQRLPCLQDFKALSDDRVIEPKPSTDRRVLPLKTFEDKVRPTSWDCLSVQKKDKIPEVEGRRDQKEKLSRSNQVGEQR
jgi:hypothetical protein